MARIFPSASESRVIADLRAIHTEVRNIESDVLDGSPCALAVINGTQGWCRFAEFNLERMSDTDLRTKAPAIAVCLRSFSDSIYDQGSQAL